MSYKFKNIIPEHQKAVIDIFNYYVINSFAAYPSVKVGDEVFKRFFDMPRRYPFKVIVHNDKEIVGFA